MEEEEEEEEEKTTVPKISSKNEVFYLYYTKQFYNLLDCTE